MSGTAVSELKQALFSLPLETRVEIVEELWENIDATSPNLLGDVDAEFEKELRRRENELDSGAVQGLTHEQVMEAVRLALACR